MLKAMTEHKFLNALCISDLQIPFEHKDALEFVQFADKMWFPGQNRVVVNMGDEVDQHSLGKFPANPSGLSAGHELAEAIHRLKDWYAVFPGKVFICNSNHTYRAWKKAYQHGIPKEFLKTVKEVYQAPVGWEWGDRWIIDGVVFEHGENVSGPTAALNAAKQNQMPTVIGHQHTHGGVIHCDSINGKIWGMNTGCLIDIEQYAFDYGKNIRNKPTLGIGIIKNGCPFFQPMILDTNRRWVKRL